MGFQVKIAGETLQVLDFSVEEAATPLAAGDSSGQVGTFRLSVPVPDPHIPPGPSRAPWTIIRTLGPHLLTGESIRIFDSRKGFTLGTIRTADVSRDGGTITFTGESRLATLNVFGIQAQPFVGTLEGAFEYYLGLAGVDTDLFVDSSIADRPVVFQGWHGELWFYLKQMAAAQDCDISLVSGVILLRPIRVRIATNDRDTARSSSTGGNSLAQAVEVYQYSNRAITNELVYPPGGWAPEVEVLNVNAGETAEYTLELSASVSSIQAPVMLENVGPEYSASSVYTIVAEDGLPVSPALWAARGGSVAISIAPDTKTLDVVLVGATGIPTASGAESQNFSLALGSDTSGNRYSTLRIVGTGVAFNKVKKRIRTGVPASRTATEVGVTIDNPFISTVDDLYRAGVRAAKQYAGEVMSLSGSVIAINRRGDTGQATYPTYAQVQSENAGLTYAVAQANLTSQGLSTHGAVQQFWLDFVRDDDLDQVFGNVQGARIYDRKTRRWYRIRTGSLTPSLITFSADDDLLHDDIQTLYAGESYADVQNRYLGMTYKHVDLVGMLK